MVSTHSSPLATPDRPAFSMPGEDYRQGIYLNLKEHVLITHHELAIVRRYAELLRRQPHLAVHVVTASGTRKSHYIAETLKHFGVSCSQISVRLTGRSSPKTNGVWLLVTERQPSR